MNYQQRYFHRQTLVFGQETQAHVRSLKVCVIGLRMVGLEVVKNLVMMGLKQVALFDNCTVEKQEVKSSIYFKPHHIGCSRAESCLQRFKELSQFTKLTHHRSNDINLISDNYDVVVLVDCWDYQFTKALNQQMRKKGKGFILLSNLSLYGFIFVDFGDKHLIKDESGQRDEKKYITNITLDSKARIYFDESKPFFPGDEIFIYNVKGMKEINGRVAKVLETDFSIKVVTVDIDTSQFSDYRSGGIAHIHRRKETEIEFECIEDNLKSVNTLPSQPYLSESQRSLNTPQSIIIRTFYQFYSKNKKMPSVLNEQQRKQIIDIASFRLAQMKAKEQQSQKVYQILSKLALVGNIQISAFATLWGGIGAQQVIKITGKYTPIHQWLHLDQTHIISSNLQPNESKYSLLFGDGMADRLSDSRIMMIGAGSVGSEIIKMATEMSLGSNKGFFTVVDSDSLSDYNLNRMCLTNEKDCGKGKAELLVSKCHQLNSSLNMRSIRQKVKQFNDKQLSHIPYETWKQHQIVVSAVDSFASRKNIDSHCVKHKKIMLNCGAQDLKCSTEVIVPYLTSNYSALVDTQENIQVPMKGYRYPHSINIAARSAVFALQDLMQIRSQLYQLTIKKQQFLKKYYEQHKKRYTEEVYTKLENIIHFQQMKQTNSFARCIEQALIKFYQWFYLQTQNLLKWHPENAISEGSRKYFWSGLMNFPQLSTLNLSDPLHCEFVVSLATVYSQILDIEAASMEQAVKIAKDIASSKAYIQISRKRYRKHVNSDSAQIQTTNSQIERRMAEEQFRTKSPMEFEAGNPSPSHLGFLYAYSMLIANRHQLEQVSRIQIEKIVCRAVPTVVTSISISAALLMIELIKIIKDDEEYTFSTNSYANFAQPKIVQSSLNTPKMQTDLHYDPIMVARIKAIPQWNSQWQQISIVGPMTVREVKERFEESFKVEVISISAGNCFLHFAYNQRTHQNLINLQVVEVLKCLKSPHLESPIQLLICAQYSVQSGTECYFPSVNYYLP